MPTYVYECAKCGDEFELYQSFSDEPLKKHPGCGGKTTKVFQPVGIVLKGSGFYKNDSRNGAKRSNGSSGKSDTTSEKSDKSESAKSETSGSTGTDSKKSESTKASDSGASKKKSESSTSGAKSA